MAELLGLFIKHIRHYNQLRCLGKDLLDWLEENVSVPSRKAAEEFAQVS